MSNIMKLPECVKFNPTVWNSTPFTENFLYEIPGRRNYVLEDDDCKIALINLFTCLDMCTIGSRLHMSLRPLISPLVALLATNIRDSERVPLVESSKEEEFAHDPIAYRKFERPISKWNEVSEEIRNAIRSVENFEVIAPSIAWAIVRFFGAGIAITDTVELELERWTRSGLSIPFPRGCVAFLHKTLPQLKDFSLMPEDITSLVKAVAVFYKSHATEPENSENVSIKKQLSIFTRCLIAEGLGPWIPFDEIASGNPLRQSALMAALQSFSENPELVQSVANLSRFHENMAKRFDGFQIQSHHVYSVYRSQMLAYMNNRHGGNSKLTAEIYKVKNALFRARSFETLDGELRDSDKDPALGRADALLVAKNYLESLPLDDRLSYFEAAENASHLGQEASTRLDFRDSPRPRQEVEGRVVVH
ncbi:uncharacterized protein LOC114828249 [Galendromus occidentalis]|uniref:Uncharacterized protein LOC114828249 n=1 Tax=Galendromus occidentalis TaxID=34638 RepID=A0AAJ7SG27_9ACAR|nr:uncharacterized protein LOC114828249 [Galendromus occidentalis]